MELGLPTNILVQDYARAVVNPNDINISSNAEIPTRVKFPSPVYLEPETEYAIVLLAPTTNLYEAWIAQMGERTVNTQSLPDAEAVVVTRQYVGGSLLNHRMVQFGHHLSLKILNLNYAKQNSQLQQELHSSIILSWKQTLELLKDYFLMQLELYQEVKVGITTTTHASSIAKMALRCSGK